MNFYNRRSHRLGHWAENLLPAYEHLLTLTHTTWYLLTNCFRYANACQRQYVGSVTFEEEAEVAPTHPELAPRRLEERTLREAYPGMVSCAVRLS